MPILEAWFNQGKFPDSLTIKINKPKDTHFHPSSANLCARHDFAIRTGDTKGEEFSGVQHRTFLMGHWAHEIIQYALVDIGLTTQDQIEKKYKRKFTTDHGNSDVMLGSADVASCVIPEHGDYLIDIKTIKGMTANKTPEDLRAYLAQYYLRQINIYMDWHKKDKALFLCVGKDTPHPLLEVEFQYDPKVVEEVYANWHSVVDAMASGIPPKCTCENNSKCPVKGLY